MFVPEGYILLLTAIGEIAAGIDAEAMKAPKPEAVQRAEDASAVVSRYLWLRTRWEISDPPTPRFQAMLRHNFH